MEEVIETRVSPDVVWAAWEKAHAMYGQTHLSKGQKGKNKFRYQVLEVKKGESFSILWKTLFVRLIFSHTVKPVGRGSQISYKVKIKGLFAIPVRWWLQEKIKKNMRAVLKAMVGELENQGIK